MFHNTKKQHKRIANKLLEKQINTLALNSLIIDIYINNKMECKVCFETYDDLDRKPWIIVNCGHTVKLFFLLLFFSLKSLLYFRTFVTISFVKNV